MNKITVARDRLAAAENNCKLFVRRHSILLFCLAACLIHLVICYSLRKETSRDFAGYVGVWITHIRENGGIFALKGKFANYSQPYLILLALFSYLPIKSLYLAKGISIIFDFILAFVVQLLVSEFCAARTKTKNIFRALSFIVVLLTPTIFINSAQWAQCDVIYTSFALLSLYFIHRKRPFAGFIFFGIALAFKLQAIFLLPFFIFFYFKSKRCSILHFFIIPATMIVCSLPSIIVGLPLSNVFSIYLEQSSYYKHTTLNLFNLYTLFPDNYSSIAPIGYALLFLFLGIITVITLKSNNKRFRDNYITIALCVVTICTFFLPNMHERYLFIGTPLSIVWAFVEYQKYTNKKFKLLLPLVPLAYELTSLLCYTPFIMHYRSDSNRWFGFLLYLSLVIFTTLYTTQSLLHNKRQHR